MVRLLPDARYAPAKIFLAYGRPRSGKGTTARVLTRVIGAANVCNPTLAAFAQNFGLAGMLGKTLAIIGDCRVSRRGQHQVMERLLSISGEDMLTIDRKYRDAVTVKLPTRLMVLSNELPQFLEASGALANRFLPVRFGVSFLGREDVGLEARLLHELPDILKWAMQGRARLLARGRFAQSDRRDELIEELQDLHSTCRQFIDEACDLGPELGVEKDVIFTEYARWCERRGYLPPDRGAFFRDLCAVTNDVRRARPRRQHRDTLPAFWVLLSSRAVKFPITAARELV